MAIKKELTAEQQKAKEGRIGKRRKHEFTKVEEKALIIAAQKGDRDALRKLVEVNKKLLLSYCRKRKNETELDIEDLEQEAIIGLIEAIHKYNLSFDVKLITYAYFSVNRALNNAVQNSKQLKISQYGFSRYRKINQVIAEETKRTGEVPSFDKIAEITGFNAEIVYYILNINNVYSIDAKNESSGDSDDYSHINIESELDNIEKKEYDEFNDLYSVIESLPYIYKAVLTDYFGLYSKPKLKISDIKYKYSLSGDSVNEILQQAYSDIKKCF